MPNPAKPMEGERYESTILIGLHNFMTCALNGAVTPYGSTSKCARRLRAVQQLLLALHDEQREQAERQVAAFFTAKDG